MTTYTFNPNPNQNFVDWSSPSVWVGGVVPSGPTADVVFPTVTSSSTGQPYVSFVSVSSDYILHSLQMTSDFLLVQGAGSLSMAGAAALSPGSEIDFYGGRLTADSFTNGGSDIQGFGLVTVTGTFLNQTRVVGNNLVVTAGGFTNAGTLAAASGDLTVNVASGGFTNLTGSTLTDGTYTAGYQGNTSSNTLRLNAGTTITALGATVVLAQGGAIVAQGSALESTLRNITSSGTLTLQHRSYVTGDLSVDGTLGLVGASAVSSSRLTVDGGGLVAGTGAINGPVDVAGELIAGRDTYDSIDGSANSLTVNGTVDGAGTLKVGAAVEMTFYGLSGYHSDSYLGATLELNGAASADVEFADTYGILKLDTPTSYNGAIQLAGYGSTVNLAGISQASITGYSYAGDSSGGTLTLQSAGGEINLDFSGNYDTASFQLSAGPQALSSSPASLNITATSLGPTSPSAGPSARQVTRLYDAAFDRHADAGELAGWMSARDNGMSLNQMAQALLDSPEFAATYGPRQTDNDFIENLYWNALNRPADDAGKTAALDALAQGSTRADLLVAISESQEHLSVGNAHQPAGYTGFRLELMRLYDTAFDRDADAGGLTACMDAHDNGMSINQMAQSLLDGGEFASMYGPGLTDSDFVETLYWNALNRPTDAGSKAAAIDALSHGTTRADLLLGLSESQEHSDIGNVHQSATDTTHRLEVMRIYDTAFDRDADEDGLVSWMDDLNRQSLTQVAQAFVDSPEFAARYGPGLSDSDFIDILYRNALNRPADPVGQSTMLDSLAQGATRADLLVSISESQEHLNIGNVHQLTQAMASSLAPSGTAGSFASGGSSSTDPGTFLTQPQS
jgi:hypothetical protein